MNNTPLNREYQLALQKVCTYLLTPWSGVLLEELTGSAASQEIPRMFGTQSARPPPVPILSPESLFRDKYLFQILCQ